LPGRRSLSHGRQRSPERLERLDTDQSITCAHDFSHSEYERVHDLNRDRYRIGPDCLALRPKRTGAAWQQLRASAAAVIEWLRVCFRQGWLGQKGRHQEPRTRTSKRVLEQTLRREENSDAGEAALRVADRAPAPRRPASRRRPP
jgi:hypothetical protein